MKIISRLLQSSRLPFKPGDTVTETRVVTRKDLDLFSNLSGDHNPVHKGNEPLVHGAFLNSFISGIIGMKLPGPGTILVAQNFNFPSKCFTEIPIDIVVELVEARKLIRLKYKCLQNENIVMEGEAKVVIRG
jgi:armadillo repeat-containing protein 7